MFKLITSILFLLIAFKITDPNLRNVFNFSDRFLMSVVPGYTSNYLNNKWNYELDKLKDVELSYYSLEKINYFVNDFNISGQCRYTLFLSGEKYRIASVLEINKGIKEYYKIYKSLESHPIRYQNIATYMVDQIPEDYVVYKISIVKKENKYGVLVAAIEKNMAFIIRLLRDKLRGIKFTDKKLDYDGMIFSLKDNINHNYKFNSWSFIKDFTVEELS